MVLMISLASKCLITLLSRLGIFYTYSFFYRKPREFYLFSRPSYKQYWADDKCQCGNICSQFLFILCWAYNDLPITDSIQMEHVN